MTKSDAHFILKRQFQVSEFYPILASKDVHYRLIDLEISQAILLAYPPNKGSAYFTFDRVFCAILNRFGIKS